MIVNGTFTSVWDGGYQVTTDCKIDTETKEVFDIEMSEADTDELEVLDEEYVTIDGVKHPVSCDKEDDTEYWYA